MKRQRRAEELDEFVYRSFGAFKKRKEFNQEDKTIVPLIHHILEEYDNNMQMIVEDLQKSDVFYVVKDNDEFMFFILRLMGVTPGVKTLEYRNCVHCGIGTSMFDTNICHFMCTNVCKTQFYDKMGLKKYIFY